LVYELFLDELRLSEVSEDATTNHGGVKITVVCLNPQDRSAPYMKLQVKAAKLAVFCWSRKYSKNKPKISFAQSALHSVSGVCSQGEAVE
jgi:hypothetical protein